MSIEFKKHVTKSIVDTCGEYGYGAGDYMTQVVLLERKLENLKLHYKNNKQDKSVLRVLMQDTAKQKKFIQIICKKQGKTKEAVRSFVKNILDNDWLQ